jgi:hypothetical protein
MFRQMFKHLYHPNLRLDVTMRVGIHKGDVRIALAL